MVINTPPQTRTQAKQLLLRIQDCKEKKKKEREKQGKKRYPPLSISHIYTLVIPLFCPAVPPIVGQMCEQDCVTWELPQGPLGNARWCQEPSRGERKWQAEGDCGAHHLFTRLERQGRAANRLWIVIRASLPPSSPLRHPNVFCHPRKVQRLIANWFFFPSSPSVSLRLLIWQHVTSGRKTVLNSRKKIYSGWGD